MSDQNSSNTPELQAKGSGANGTDEDVAAITAPLAALTKPSAKSAKSGPRADKQVLTISPPGS